MTHAKRKNCAIELVIFDWAGTTIDFGSRAPAAAFTGVFAAFGIDVTDPQARGPMGLNKREHLRTMLSDPPIAKLWQDVHGRPFTEADVDRMYDAFIPIQLQAIREHADLVPGLLEVIAELRSRKIKIGGTTGYFRQAADAVAEIAARANFDLHANVCADDVAQGRPAPWMIHRVMEKLAIFPPAAVVKVGDTVADIAAGLAAGCWSIGVCDSSSLVGLSVQQYRELGEGQRESVLAQAERTFRAAGAHAVVRSISELPGLVDSLSGPPRAIE